LIHGLEKIGFEQIFELIGDSLNPTADAERHGKIERMNGSASVMNKGQRSRQRTKQSSLIVSPSVANNRARQAPVARLSGVRLRESPMTQEGVKKALG
jgi:hypothetical protein